MKTRSSLPNHKKRMKSRTVWPTHWLRETLEAAQGLLPVPWGLCFQTQILALAICLSPASLLSTFLGSCLSWGRERWRKKKNEVSWNKVSFWFLDSISMVLVFKIRPCWKTTFLGTYRAEGWIPAALSYGVLRLKTQKWKYQGCDSLLQKHSSDSQSPQLKTRSLGISFIKPEDPTPRWFIFYETGSRCGHNRRH